MGNGTGTDTVVLIIEQDNIRKVVSSTLRKAGFGIVALPNMDATPAELFSESAAIRLAIVDAESCRHKGLDFFRKLVQMVPGIRVLFLADSKNPEILCETGEHPQFRVIQKPFRRARLLGQVLDVIREPLALRA